MELIPWKGDQERIPTTISETMRREGYAVSAHPLSKHSSEIPYTNREDESLWLVRGNIVVNVANQKIAMNPGDRLMIPKNTKYSYKSDTDAAYFLLGKKIESVRK